MVSSNIKKKRISMKNEKGFVAPGSQRLLKGQKSLANKLH